MSLTLIPGEKIVKDEDYVWYFSGFSRLGHMIVGHLILTTKRLLLYEKQHRDRRTLETSGLAINLPLGTLVGARVEERVRSKSSRPNWRNTKDYAAIISGQKKVNQAPGFLDAKETYYVLMMTFTTDSGTENPTFEVTDPIGWADAINKLYTSESSSEA